MQEADERAEIQGKAVHLTANLFAVAFGVAGLAQPWSTVTQLAGTSDWPGNVLWIVAAVAWLITLAAERMPKEQPADRMPKEQPAEPRSWRKDEYPE